MREAAVLAPLFRDDAGVLRLVLIARAEAGMHPGHVSLAGGKRAANDASPLITALREAEEEIGLTEEQVEVLAQLEPLETHTTRLCVYPFVARIPAIRCWQPHGAEVAAVLTPSVETLADPARRTSGVFTFPTWPEPRRSEQVALSDGHVVWGLTLRLLDRLLPRVLSGEWNL